MLSKEGFKYHLDMVDHNTIMAETYKIRHPEVAKRCLEMVDESKQILLNHFEKTQQKIQGVEEQANAMAEKHAEKDIIMGNMQQEIERLKKELKIAELGEFFGS